MKTMTEAPPRTVPGSEISSAWGEILRDLPGGYDPIATAPPEAGWDERAAEVTIAFFERGLRHVKGTAGPFLLERWQKAILANLFGWFLPDPRAPGGRVRRYREAFVYVPRKNGKTALAAGLATKVLACECGAEGKLTPDGDPRELGGECYAAAADRDQASLVFSVAKAQVDLNPELQGAIKSLQYHLERLDDPLSSFKAISADAASKHGYNAQLVIVDELHAQRDGELVDVLETSQASRRQPLVIYITTADYDRPSICNEKYLYACEVRDGVIDDPSHLPVIYELPQALEHLWNTPEGWRLANPNFGVSVSESYLRKKALKADRQPRFKNSFLRLHLNVRTGQVLRWITLEAWDACYGKRLEALAEEIFDGEPRFATGLRKPIPRERLAEELSGKVCYLGLDLASVQDIAAAVLVFPSLDGETWILPQFWIPQDRLEERSRDGNVPFSVWCEEGWIRSTPGRTIDQAAIKTELLEWFRRYQIREVGLDPWNAQAIAQALEKAGHAVAAFSQGFSTLSGPSKAFEALVYDGKLAHGGNPVLRWMANNVAVEEDSFENIRPSKKKSGEKIDGIVATIFAIGRAALGAGPDRSVYESRGLL